MSEMDELDRKLNETFDGKVLRKDLLHRIKKMDRQIVVIVVTAFATVETAVRALKEGAYDYITKPIDPDEVLREAGRRIQRGCAALG